MVKCVRTDNSMFTQQQSVERQSRRREVSSRRCKNGNSSDHWQMSLVKTKGVCLHKNLSNGEEMGEIFEKGNPHKKTSNRHRKKKRRKIRGRAVDKGRLDNHLLAGCRGGLGVFQLVVVHRLPHRRRSGAEGTQNAQMKTRRRSHQTHQQYLAKRQDASVARRLATAHPVFLLLCN